MTDTDNNDGVVHIDLGSHAAAKHFINWLCGQGEQNYWVWMECREDEEAGPITATRFKYDYENASAVGEMGRLQDDQ
tara:strand:- start:323 stop:553 length:231 start_codon:yes stop_codon:yes gene_type:complete